MTGNNIFSNILATVRILVGLVFIFSGFVKGVDPLGTTYKLTDYFNAFNLEFLNPLALFFSIILNMSEFVLGVALVSGIYLNVFVWMALVYMVFFTPLTFGLAIYDPVTDCGCFGDAIVMTNWQTFYKNVAITAMVGFLFINRKKLTTYLNSSMQRNLVIGSVVCFLLFSWYNYRHLPMMDFRPYKIGTSIPEGMEIPEGAPQDSFKYVLVYKKGDITREFSLDNIPADDTTWQWVETKTELIRKGYHPPIHDFSFSNLVGDNVTDSIIQDTSYVFLAISHDLYKASVNGLMQLKRIYEEARSEKYKLYLATSSTPQQIDRIRKDLDLPISIYTADDIMLKTVVRSNPGLVLIKNGIIIDKWHYNDIPETGDISKICGTERSEYKSRLGRF